MSVEEILWKHPDVRDEEGKLVRELHGVTLQDIVETLARCYDWDELHDRVRIQCFINEPSVKSTLTFLRRTPWARTKVEQLYVAMRTADLVGIRRP